MKTIRFLLSFHTLPSEREKTEMKGKLERNNECRVHADVDKLLGGFSEKKCVLLWLNIQNDSFYSNIINVIHEVN